MKPKVIIDKVLGDTLYVKLFYLLIMITQMQIITKDIAGPFVKLSLVYGFLVFVYDFFTRKRIIRNKFFPLIAIFFGLMFISIAVNYNKGFVENFKLFAYAAFEFFVIAMVPSDKSEEDIKREYKIISIVAIIAIAVIGLASFVTFAFYIQTTYTNHIGGLCYVGVAPDNRLYGITGNANSLGMQMLTLFALAISYIAIFKPKRKIPLYAVMLLSILCMLLSGSRASAIGFIAFAFCFIFFWIMSKTDKKPLFKLYIKNALISLLITVVLFVGGKAVTFVSGYIPSIIQSTTEMEIKDSEEVEKLFERFETERNDTETMVKGSGRIDLWNAALKIFQHHPIFGVGFAEVQDYANKYMPGTDLPIAKWGGGVHNIFLQVLASGGILAFIAFLGIMAFFAVKAFIKLFADFKNGESSMLFITAFSVIIMLLVIQLFEVRMIYRITAESLFFALFFGYLQYYLQKKTDDVQPSDSERK